MESFLLIVHAYQEPNWFNRKKKKLPQEQKSLVADFLFHMEVLLIDPSIFSTSMIVFTISSSDKRIPEIIWMLMLTINFA